MSKALYLILLVIIVTATISRADNGCGTSDDLPDIFSAAVLEPPPPGSPTSVISLLIAYTPQAATDLINAGDDIASYTNWELGRLNQAMSNSNVNAQFVMVGTPFPLQQNAPMDLNAVDTLHVAYENAFDNGDGVWDEIYAERNTRGADLILIIYEGSGGKATLSRLPGPSTARDGVALMSINSIRYVHGATFSHEVGHLLGLHHDTSNGGTVNSGVHPFSLGYRFTGLDSILYRTIMAYSPGDLYLGFSNPSRSHQGVPTGVENQFNEAYTISSTAPIIANYSDVVLCDPNRTLQIYLRKEAASALINIYLEDRNGDGSLNSQTTFTTWQFSSGSWARQGSGTVTTTNNYVAFGSPNTTVKIRAYPDSYVESNSLTIPNLSNAVISIGNSSSLISGTVTVGGTPVNITGNWLDIIYRTTPNGTPTKVATLPVNSTGNFSYTALVNGYYTAEIPTHGQESNKLTINSIATPTPTPTASPTPIATATPSSAPTALPTTQPTAAPTQNPSPTARPTEVPTQLPAPTGSPTSAPQVYTLTITPKAMTKTKFLFGGELALNGLPQKSKEILLSCDGKSVGKARTGSNGRFEKWVNRDRQTKKCQAKFESIYSKFIRVPKK